MAAWLAPGTLTRHALRERHQAVIAKWAAQLARNGGLAPVGMLDDLAEVTVAYMRVAAREAVSPAPGAPADGAAGRPGPAAADQVLPDC